MPTTLDRLPARPLTYEDYCEIPEDGNRYEILDGELFVTPAPRPKHQVVLGNLHLLLRLHVDGRRLGTVFLSPIDLILSRTNVAQPDLVFVAAGRESIVTDRAIESPPDLAVEIVSPSSRRQDRKTKFAIYARFGIPHYWILDPEERTFEVFGIAAGGYELLRKVSGDGVLSPEPFPDLGLDLAKLWA